MSSLFPTPACEAPWALLWQLRHSAVNSAECRVLPCDMYDDGIISTSGCHHISPNSTGITLRCKTLQQRIQKKKKKGSCAPTYNPWHKMSSPEPVTLVLVFLTLIWISHQRREEKKNPPFIISGILPMYSSLSLSLSLSLSPSLPPLGRYWRKKVFFHHSQAWLPQSSFFFFLWYQRRLSVFKFVCCGPWMCVGVKAFSADRVNCRWKMKKVVI